MTFETFSKHLSKIEATTKRNDITALLANLLKEASADEIDSIVYLSLGQLAPLYALKEFSMADKMVIRAIARAFGKETSEVRSQYKKSGDLGATAEEMASKGGKERGKKENMHVRQVFKDLTDIAEESGEGSQERKLERTASLLQAFTPLEARYVIRIILNKLRLGFSDKTVLDALSVMTKGDKSAREQLEASYNVRPDVGWIAKEIQSLRGRSSSGGPSSIRATPTLGVPILASLCQRLPSTEEIVEKMEQVAVEPKWDGQRIQAHVWILRKKDPLRLSEAREGKRIRGNNQHIVVKLFTRGLENVTDMFPDLAESLKRIFLPSSFFLHPSSFILDGEVVGIDPNSGKILPFQTMITRKRKYGITEQLKSVPIQYMVFDILFLNGESLLEKPFSKRREILERMILGVRERPSSSGRNIHIAPQIITSNPKEIRDYLHKQTRAGLEGIVTKQWSAPYSPGRTGFTWVKMKWEGEAKSGGLLDTIDCVVMGTYAGRGKRSDFGIGAFLVGIKAGEGVTRRGAPHRAPGARSVAKGKSSDGAASWQDPEAFHTISKIGTGLSDEQWRKLKTQSSKLKVQNCPKAYIIPKELTPDVWLEPKIVVEIQADNITNSPLHTAGYALRFPRLVRYRTDKRPEQITTLEEVKRLYKMQGESK